MESSEPEDLANRAPSAGIPRTTQQTALVSLAVFAIVPAIFLFIAFQLTKASGPQWLGSNFENNYMYLFNSLLIAKGEPPFCIEHPGTTTQVFGAAVLKGFGGTSGDQLVGAVLNNPEKFLKYIRKTLLITCALALWIFPWLAAVRSGSYMASVLLQLPILFFNTILHYSIWFCSELTLVAFSIGAVSLGFLLLRQAERGTQNLPVIILAGIVCGLGTVTKLTFFPLTLITLICCRGLRSFVVFGASLLATVVLALLPIYPELPRLYQWILGISTHSGRYGGGTAGFVTVHYLADVITLLAGEPFVWLIPTLSTGTIGLLTIHTGLKSLNSSALRWVASAYIVFMAQVASFIVVAKHPGYRYLIPIYFSTGLSLGILWRFTSLSGSRTRLRFVGFGVTVLLISLGICSLVFRTPALYRSLRHTRDSELAMYTRKERNTKNALTVYYWGAIGPEFAMWDADAYARSAFADILEKKFPNTLFYNVNSGNFQTFDSILKPEDVLKKYDHFYLFGNKLHTASDDYEFLLRPEYLDRVVWFKAKNLRVVDRQGPYVLEEWTRE